MLAIESVRLPADLGSFHIPNRLKPEHDQQPIPESPSTNSKTQELVYYDSTKIL